VGLELKSSQRFGEVTRTYLTSSTRAVDGFGKAEFLFLRHRLNPFGDIVPVKTEKLKVKSQSHNVKIKALSVFTFQLWF
jgi:hypothetical protein